MTADPLSLWQTMYTVRRLSAEFEDMFARSLMPGGMHLSTGQEATSAGVVNGLESSDWIFPTYRNMPYMIARGVSVEQVIREVLTDPAGIGCGRLGAKHLGSLEHRVAPGNAIVGGGVGTAVGFSFARQRSGEGGVAAAVVGDGAMNQGVVYEALNMASVNRVPMILICENNGYGEMTPLAVSTAGRLCDRARSFGAHAVQCDGNDALAVVDVIANARAVAVSERRPVFVESLTYRTCGHMCGDPGGYRSVEEVERWVARDPVALLERYLQNRELILPEELQSLKGVVDGEIRDARARALAASGTLRSDSVTEAVAAGE